MSPVEQAARALAAAYNGIVRADPLPCYRCGKVPEVDPNGGYPTVSCSDCYDGAPDSGSRSEVGSGLTRAEAVDNWNQAMEMEEPFAGTVAP